MYSYNDKIKNTFNCIVLILKKILIVVVMRYIFNITND